MNKSELINEIAKKTDLTKKESARVLDSFITTVTKTLKKGKKVSITGFGSWEVRSRKARTGVNPQTGSKIKIKAKKVPKFNAGKHLRESVK
ncbi:MAG: HU family DNA-binding protein [bacterium]|nr:HU family DNA-binding protein [bacterium]